jgi:tRNA1Val (adenine37-N6)-methyltransferase
MANSYFNFKKFSISHDKCAMKVTTDACVFGAYVAKEISSNTKIETALDIGTGTSLLSQMIAQSTKFFIDAIELDKSAFEQAVENNSASPYGKKINIINGDARTFSYEKSYDLIFSNPPFYEQDLKSPNAQKNLAHHDEGLLLDDLANIISVQLTPSGQFFILLPYKREAEAIALFSNQELVAEKVMRVKPTTASPYSRSIISGRKGQGAVKKIAHEEIAIQENNQYTDSAKELLKPYYLFL